MSNSKSQLPSNSGFNTQNYLKLIEVQNSTNLNPLAQSYQENMKPNNEYKITIKEEAKNIFEIQNQKDKFMIKSEYDNKSLDTKSQVTQITDTVHSYKPSSLVGTHLQQKSLNNRRSFQKFKSPLLNQKEIDMHLKDINNQYVIESEKESKSNSKTNELKNQYKAQIQSSSKSSQQIDSTKNFIQQKQKLMTIQQNESQDMKIGNPVQEVQKIEIQRQSMQEQILKQYAEIVDQESLNAIASKYQSLKSYYGQNQGSGSNHKNANLSDLESNNEVSKQNKIVREFDSKKNSDYYNRLQQNNKQKLSVSKKSSNARNLNIKSSREETSFKRNQKQLQFEQDQNNGPLYEQKLNYSDNLSAYDMNKSTSLSQNIKEFGYKKNNYQIQPVTSHSIKGQLLSTQKLIANQFQNQEIKRIKTPFRQKSTISDNFSRKIQNQETVIQFLTEHDIKRELMEAFQKIRLDIYSDILRIKKPQSQAHIAGQLLCKTVNSFRGGQNKHIGVDSKFLIWETIQEYVHKQPNVIKFNQEITQLIQHMILSKDYLNQIKSDQLKNHLKKIQKIQQQYFGLKTKSEIIKQFLTNKNFQVIVNLCFCICRYVLYHSRRTNQINLKYEQLVNFEDQRSRSNIRSDYEKTSTQRSHISQNIGQKSESISTNLFKGQNEKLQVQSEGFHLNQSISTKVIKRKSPPKIQDKMMIESINSMCTPKQSIAGFKNNILQSRENKTDMVRKSTIRKEDSFKGISKLKNFQYLNESFRHSNKKNIENKQSPIQQISQDINIFHQNQLSAAQNYSFIQQSQNLNLFQQKNGPDFKNSDIIQESNNEYNEKIKIPKISDMKLDSKRSIRSNKKLLQSSYYFTPQGKNLSAHTQSDQKASYQINPKQVKKLKVFDRLSLSGVQRKKFQQNTFKNSPQKLTLFSQANEVIKHAADSVKLNIIHKQISEYQNEQSHFNLQNEKEDFILMPQKKQSSTQDLKKQISQHSFNNQSITNSQEINNDQEQRLSPNKFPDTSNLQQNFQHQSLYNPSLIIQVKNQENKNKIESSRQNKQQILFIQSIKKNVNDEEIQNFSRQSVDISTTNNMIQIQLQTIKQRKSRQDRSAGKKSVNKQSKLLKSNIKTFDPADYNQQNLDNLDEFVQIEQNVLVQQEEEVVCIKDQQIDSEKQINMSIQVKEDITNAVANIDDTVNEIFEQIDQSKNQIQEQTNDYQDEQIQTNNYQEDQNIYIEEVDLQEPRVEKIDMHYLQAYNSINEMPFQIVANEEEKCEQASEQSEQENECYIDPVQEAQRIIGIIKAEFDKEENDIPQIQELKQTKTDQITQHQRSNSYNQMKEQENLNDLNKTLHKKNQTFVDFSQDNFGDSQSQENTEQSIQQYSILETKFQAMKKFKYLEILRNKKNLKAKIQYISYNNDTYDQDSAQLKVEQNIQQQEIKQNNDFIRNSNNQIEEPLTAEIPFLKLIDQQEQMPFELNSEKISLDEQNETQDQLQYEQFDEFLEQNTNEKKGDRENKSSEENEQYYMQEIVSPFRKLRASLLNQENKPQSPIKNEDDPAVILDKIEWEINPVQIRRNSKELEIFEQENEESKNEFQELNFDNDAYDYFNESIQVREDCELISPGKLKSNVTESRKHIMERISETQKEIEGNSPTRNSGVNIDMIQKLKERRIQKRKTQEEADSILQSIQD